MTESWPSRRSDQSLGRPGLLALILAIAGLVLPLLLGWWFIGRTPNFSPADVHQRLETGKIRLVAVDVHVQSAFPEAGFWPIQDILAIRNPKELPAEFQGQDLVLVCPGGIQGALAARHLVRIGFPSVHSLRGGLQAWIAEGQDGASYRPSPLSEQLAAVLSFFGVKFIYSLLSAGLILLLWGEASADLVALRRSMAAFFVGEAFCFINVMAFGDQSLLLEYLHSAGMVLSLALVTYALLEGLDLRVIHFSDQHRCAFQGLCRTCFKHAKVPCALRRIFLLSLPACIVTSALPLFAPFQHAAYTTRILGVLHGYRHPVLQQIYELRILPWLAILLFLACLLVLLSLERRSVPVAKVLFSAASGALAFSFFRMVLVAVFAQHQVWFAAWEEFSELLFVAVACGGVLIFRQSLLTQPRFASLFLERNPS